MNWVEHWSRPDFVFLPRFRFFFSFLKQTVHILRIFLPRFRWCYFLELIGLKWRLPKHARVLKTTNFSVFFAADLFVFLLFFDSSSIIFFVLCLFFNFLVMNELSRTLVTIRFQIFEVNSWSFLLFLPRCRCIVSTFSLSSDFSHPFSVFQFFFQLNEVSRTLVTARFQVSQANNWCSYFIFTQNSLYFFSFLSVFQFFTPFLCFGFFVQMNEIWVEHWSLPDFRFFNFRVDLFFYFYPYFVVFFQLLLCHPIFLSLFPCFGIFFQINELSTTLVATRFHVFTQISFYLQLHILLIFLPRFFSCYFLLFTSLKSRVQTHATVLKSKRIWIFFVAESYWYVNFIVFQLSQCFWSYSSIFTHISYFIYLLLSKDCLFSFILCNWSYLWCLFLNVLIQEVGFYFFLLSS